MRLVDQGFGREHHHEVHACRDRRHRSADPKAAQGTAGRTRSGDVLVYLPIDHLGGTARPGTSRGCSGRCDARAPGRSECAGSSSRLRPALRTSRSLCRNSCSFSRRRAALGRKGMMTPSSNGRATFATCRRPRAWPQFLSRCCPCPRSCLRDMRSLSPSEGGRRRTPCR